jgi:hypothetical protein
MMLTIHIVASLFVAAQGSPAKGVQDREQFGRNLVIETGERAADATCKLCSITVRGVLEGDAVALGGTVEVSGEIAGDVVTVGGGVRLAQGAQVKGDAIVIGGPLERAKGSQLGGEVIEIPWFALPGQRRVFLPGALGSVAMSLLAVSVFYAAARQRRIEHMAELLRRHYLLVPVAGVALLIVALFLMDWRIHTPQASQIKDYVVLAAVVVVSGLGWTATSRQAGRLARMTRPFIATLAGAIALTLLSLIPYVGLAFAAALFVLALGIPLTSGLAKFAGWRPFSRRNPAQPATPAR